MTPVDMGNRRKADRRDVQMLVRGLLRDIYSRLKRLKFKCSRFWRGGWRIGGALETPKPPGLSGGIHGALGERVPPVQPHLVCTRSICTKRIEPGSGGGGMN